MSLNERLEKCAAAIHRLDKGGNPVPQIEIDMALEELRRLYEAVLQLNVPVAAAAPEPAAPQEPAAEPLKEEVVVPGAPILLVQEETPSAPEETSVVLEPEPEPEPEPVPEPEPEPEPVVEQAPVVEPAPAPARPAEEPTLFAEDQSEMATPSSAMPTVEQVSDMPNDTLFADEPAAPATIWEKLQSQQAAPSFADTVQPQQTLSERLAEQKPAPEPTPLHQPTPQAAPAVEPQPQPEPAAVQPIPEPEPAPKPASEPTPEPQPAPASPASAQPSLMDILKQTNTTHTPVAAQRMLGDTFTAPTTVEDDFVQPRKHKVDDLRTVININDKFSFMSELFHNNMKAYNDFIMTLNVTPTREEALEIVANTSSQYEWDEDSVAVKNFYNILNRKF